MYKRPEGKIRDDIITSVIQRGWVLRYRCEAYVTLGGLAASDDWDGFSSLNNAEGLHRTTAEFSVWRCLVVDEHTNTTGEMRRYTAQETDLRRVVGQKIRNKVSA